MGMLYLSDHNADVCEAGTDNEVNNANPSNATDKLDYIMKSGGVISRSDGETIHCLTIIG